MGETRRIKTQEGGYVKGTLKGERSYDIGEHCTHCAADVSFGSGLYVNRIPSDAYAHNENDHLVGWMCAECQTLTCETCNEQTLDYTMRPEGGVVCDDCLEKEGTTYE